MKQDDTQVVKVSDWSQKYKLAIYAVSGAGITWAGYMIYSVLVDIKLLLGQILIVLLK